MSKHIVIAEDDPHLSTLIDQVMDAAGFRTTIALNGRVAFSIIENCLHENTGVDLLLTDISMPIMDGEELIAALRRQSIRIPIIAMTENGDKDMVVKLMRLGCQDFIDKPFQPDELQDRVRMILEKTYDEMSAMKRKERLAKIGERTRSIIHDLNNMLGATIGYADMALEEVDKNHPVHAKLDKIYNGVSLAADICNKLMSVNSDTPFVLKTNTEIMTLVDNAVHILQAIAPDTVDIRTQTPGYPIWLRVDPERIQQALLNLGSNALDAIGKKGVLTFSAAKVDYQAKNGTIQPGVSITVADTGNGIPGDNIGKLFTEEFTTKQSGSGIGLPTVKRIVDEHHGTIAVESRQGEGTRFQLLFPMADSTK